MRAPRRLGVALIAVAAVAALATLTVAQGRGAVDRYLVIRSSRGFQLGAYRVSAAQDTVRNPHLTAAAAVSALGPPSSCENSSSDPRTMAFYTWRGYLTSEYSIPAFGARVHPTSGPLACQIPRSKIWLASFSTIGHHWHTNRGLKIGDPSARVGVLYPDATQPDGAQWSLGNVPLPHFHGATMPALDISISEGKVSGFDLNLSAAAR